MSSPQNLFLNYSKTLMLINNHAQLRDYIRKIVYDECWVYTNYDVLAAEILQQRKDEADLEMIKLMNALKLPMCTKYQMVFDTLKNPLNSEVLVERIFKKLLKASYKWNTRTASNIDLLGQYMVNPHRDSFDTLPELGIRNSPFTDFLLEGVLVKGLATAMQVYQQLQIVENKNLHYYLGHLFGNPEINDQIKILKNEGIEFLEEFLCAEQEAEAFSKEMEGRGLFNDENWEGAIQSFIESSNLSDKRKSICYPFICICYIILNMNISSEEYLYKSTEYFNSEDGECARLYGIALAGHGELIMGKQIFTRSLSDYYWDEDSYENYYQIPAVKEILDKLLNEETSSLTFLPSPPRSFFEFEEINKLQ